MSRRQFIPYEGYSERKQLAHNYASWLAQMNFDLFVTLNFNTERNIKGVRHQYGQWLARIDRKYLGPKWYRKPTVERTFAIGIIENPRSNIHIHSLVTLPQRNWGISYSPQSLLPCCWSDVQPAGSCDVQEIDGDLPRITSYMCKQLHRRGHLDNCIIMAADFHTHR
jgi:hypothetical protein